MFCYTYIEYVVCMYKRKKRLFQDYNMNNLIM